jgi:hypothetical protein
MDLDPTGQVYGASGSARLRPILWLHSHTLEVAACVSACGLGLLTLRTEREPVTMFLGAVLTVAMLATLPRWSRLRRHALGWLHIAFWGGLLMHTLWTDRVRLTLVAQGARERLQTQQGVLSITWLLLGGVGGTAPSPPSEKLLLWLVATALMMVRFWHLALALGKPPETHSLLLGAFVVYGLAALLGGLFGYAARVRWELWAEKSYALHASLQQLKAQTAELERHATHLEQARRAALSASVTSSAERRGPRQRVIVRGRRAQLQPGPLVQMAIIQERGWSDTRSHSPARSDTSDKGDD